MLPCNAKIQNTAHVDGWVFALCVCLLNGGIKTNSQLSYFSFFQDSASSLILIWLWFEYRQRGEEEGFHRVEMYKASL